MTNETTPIWINLALRVMGYPIVGLVGAVYYALVIPTRVLSMMTDEVLSPALAAAWRWVNELDTEAKGRGVYEPVGRF